jgi:hypothetical protein
VVKADAARASAVPGQAAERFAYGPGQASRAVREYLEGLEVADRPESARSNISVTDPAAEWTCAPGGPAFFAYSTNYLVDVRAGVIVDVEGTSAHRTQEVNATRTMIDRVEERFGIKPEYLIGDTAYGNAATLGWLVNDKQIDPYIPVWTRADGRKGIMPNSDFTWNEKKDEYRCPQGQPLRREWRPFRTSRTHITKAATIIYRASQRDCASCPLKRLCCPSTPMRKIARSIHEQARDVARDMAKRRSYRQSRRDRKKVEMLFAHFKRILKMDRLRLRGINGARDEFLLAAIAQNLRRMAKKLCATAPPMVLA